MLEPLSIAAGVTSIVFNCLKGLQTVKQYGDKYNLTELKLLALSTECSTLHLALLEIQRLLSSNTFPQPEALSQHAKTTFESLFGQCSTVFAILDERLRLLLTPTLRDDNRPEIKSKIAAVWNDSEIDQLSGLVRGQIQGVQLLLTAFQTGSIFQTHQILSSNDAAQIFRRVADDTQSLYTSHRTQSITQQTGDLNTEGYVSRDEEFFPNALLESKAYRRAFMDYLRSQGQNIGANPLKESETTSWAQPESIVEENSSPNSPQDTISERGTVKTTRPELEPNLTSPHAPVFMTSSVIRESSSAGLHKIESRVPPGEPTAGEESRQTSPQQRLQVDAIYSTSESPKSNRVSANPVNNYLPGNIVQEIPLKQSTTQSLFLSRLKFNLMPDSRHPRKTGWRSPGEDNTAAIMVSPRPASSPEALERTSRSASSESSRVHVVQPPSTIQPSADFVDPWDYVKKLTEGSLMPKKSSSTPSISTEEFEKSLDDQASIISELVRKRLR